MSENIDINIRMENSVEVLVADHLARASELLRIRRVQYDSYLHRVFCLPFVRPGRMNTLRARKLAARIGPDDTASSLVENIHVCEFMGKQLFDTV
jgi:hypothetical protein